ncbi:OmpH family outer membrane protein, partial [Alistipes putredinis]
KEKELTDLQNRLQEFYQSAQEDLQKKEKELTDPIVAKAQEAVKKVAQKGAYVAVFNTTIPSMVYYDEAAMTDLSTEVKAELGIQ